MGRPVIRAYKVHSAPEYPNNSRVENTEVTAKRLDLDGKLLA